MLRPISAENKRRELMVEVDAKIAAAQGDPIGAQAGLAESLQDENGDMFWMWGWSKFGGTTRPKLASDLFDGDGTEMDGVEVSTWAEAEYMEGTVAAG